MKKRKTTVARFELGDWVSFRWGAGDAIAQVIEQRGAIGIGQRHLYRLHLERDCTEPDLFELPEDHLEPASPPPDRPSDAPMHPVAPARTMQGTATAHAKSTTRPRGSVVSRGKRDIVKKRKPPVARYKVGDWVSFRWGVRDAIAQVIEQLGPLLGPERKHLYRIRLERDSTEPDLFEMPEDELEPASPP